MAVASDQGHCDTDNNEGGVGPRCPHHSSETPSLDSWQYPVHRTRVGLVESAVSDVRGSRGSGARSELRYIMKIADEEVHLRSLREYLDRQTATLLYQKP